METIDYQKQGEDFLKDCKVKMSVKHTGFKPHFVDDKVSRNCYRVTFSRVLVTTSGSGTNLEEYKEFSVSFGQSIAEGLKTPTAYDVLTCLTKYEPGTLENFCSDFGYDTDSKKAEKTYKAVVKEWEKVSSFFSESELEQLAEIQ